MRAAISMSSKRPLAHEPICAWMMRVPATSPTGHTLPNWWGFATTNGISSTLSRISFS